MKRGTSVSNTSMEEWDSADAGDDTGPEDADAGGPKRHRQDRVARSRVRKQRRRKQAAVPLVGARSNAAEAGGVADTGGLGSFNSSIQGSSEPGMPQEPADAMEDAVHRPAEADPVSDAANSDPGYMDDDDLSPLEQLRTGGAWDEYLRLFILPSHSSSCV